MMKSVGGNDHLSFCWDWQIATGSSTLTSINIIDNCLYGDAYGMSKSQGGDDELRGADVSGATTYMTGDACTSDADSVAGNDCLISGSGDDHMWGDFGGKDNIRPTDRGAFGRDTFIFSAVIGHDVIYDFHQSEDLITFQDVVGVQQFSDLSDKLFAAGDGGQDTLIKFDESNSITLIGIQSDQLTTEDFQFSP